MCSAIRKAVILVVVLVASGQMVPAFAEPLFSFGEMRELQTLPDQAGSRSLAEDELILYQNMEFYAFTTFEALLAANNAVMAVGAPPLFCAPEGTFRFRDGADIAVLLAELTDGLLSLVKEVGATEEHYDQRPASEALLFALRAVFPCDDVEIETVSATP
ncbi:MAG: hypothetical protein R3349_06695 [Geminicoccaceae bacterium]|nr:hypothetical protein [Geminicoccaceae bacterium]